MKTPRHRLSDIDMEQKTATCAACGPRSRITIRGKKTVRVSCYTKRLEESRTPAAVVGRRRRNLQHRYGLTIEDYSELERVQGGRCALCDVAPTYRLLVDHCHETGAVRGLLCSKCNNLLAALGDNRARRLALYLGA